jgi:Rrf2 family protein
MHLKGQVEWALHCSALLAGLPPGVYLSTKDLAEFHGIPKEYLSKALQGMSQAGLVESTLGPRGGYRLAKAPQDITFLDIVEAVEGKQSTFNCSEIRKNNPCRSLVNFDTHLDAKPCGIARIMWEADDAWRESLRRTTLADLVAMLPKELPTDLLEKTTEWISTRL